MKLTLTVLNTICTDLSGTGGHRYEIQALNEICTLCGGSGGHTRNLAAINELCALYSATPSQSYEIDSLQSLYTTLGGTGSFSYLYDYWYSVQQGGLLNVLSPTVLTATALDDVSIKLDWTVNAVNPTGHRIYISNDNVNFTEKGTVAGTTATYTATGLSNYTRYYFKIVAYKGVTESTAATVDKYTLYSMGLTATGTGTGVSTLRLTVSANITVTATGTAKFYSDAAGTADESATWAVTSGALRTIYLKCPTATAKLIFSDVSKITSIGSAASDGWLSSTNAANVSINLTPIYNALYLNIAGNSVLAGNLSTVLQYYRLDGNGVTRVIQGSLPSTLTALSIKGTGISGSITGDLPAGLTFIFIEAAVGFASSNPLPTGLTYIRIIGSLFNWTGTSILGSANITSQLSLLDYRLTKMSSADMVTLLNSLAARTGGLPATITINDYADYASPPQAVTDAVAALKVAKPNVTTVNLGA